MIRRRHSSNSNIPVFDTLKTPNTSDSDTLKSSKIPTTGSRVPSFRSHNTNNYPPRKCLSSNVTPISSPLIPKSRLNNLYNNTTTKKSSALPQYKSKSHNVPTSPTQNKQQQHKYPQEQHLQQHKFSQEIIESSSKLIIDIDQTLTQLSQQYYNNNNSDNYEINNYPFSQQQQEPTTPTTRANNNIVDFSQLPTTNNNNNFMFNKLKPNKHTVDTTSINNNNNNNNPTETSLSQQSCDSPIYLKSTKIHHQNRPTKLQSEMTTKPTNKSQLQKKSKQSNSVAANSNSYTEAWLYNSRLDTSEPTNKISLNPNYQSSSSSGSELQTQNQSVASNQNKELKFPQKYYLNNSMKDAAVNRDSGISSSKESWVDSSMSVAMAAGKSNLPLPPPRVSSLKANNNDYIAATEHSSSDASRKHVSKADKRKARELYASVKQRDDLVKLTNKKEPVESIETASSSIENSMKSTEQESSVEELMLSDVDGQGLKTSGYVSDTNSLSDHSTSTLGLYAQRMQQRFKEGLQAVQESMQITSGTQKHQGGPIARDDLSSTSSDEIEDYLKDLSSRLGSSSISPNRINNNSSACSNNSRGSSNLSKRSTPTLTPARDNDLKERLYQKRLAQYANDLEPASDFDITSSCSMDLLTGKAISDECESNHDDGSLIGSSLPSYEFPYRSSTASSHASTKCNSNSTTRNTSRRDCELHEAAGPTSATLDSTDDDPSHYPRAMSLPGRPSRTRSNSVPWQHQQQHQQQYPSVMPLEINTSLGYRTAGGASSIYYDIAAAPGPSSSSSSSLHGNWAWPRYSTGGSCRTSDYNRQIYGGSCTPISLMNVRLPYNTTGATASTTNAPHSHNNNEVTSSYYSNQVKPSNSTSSLGGYRCRDESNNDEIYEGLGSRLSLLSSGSYRSLNEERQASEIRRLRRELELAQQKVKSLTGQLSSNGNMVNAFENSLQSMSLRLHKFAATSESKENELNELKNTIHELKKQASSTSPIQNDQTSPKIYATSSLTSLSSNSNSVDKRSDGSLKKSSWLKNSLGRAFRKKASSNKDEGSTESINEVHKKSNGGSISNNSNSNITNSNSHCNSNNGSSSRHMHESESLQALRKELEEKDARLTDVQLDALSRSHQLEQLRDLLTKMRYEMSSLKADNCRLQNLMDQSHSSGAVVANSNSTTGNCSTTNPEAQMPTDIADCATIKSSTSSSKPKFDFMQALVKEREPCQALLVSVTLSNVDSANAQSNKSLPSEVVIGRVGLSTTTSWSDLETQLKRLLKEYLAAVDPNSSLGLNGESISRYRLNSEQYITVSSAGSMRPLTSPLTAANIDPSSSPESKVLLQVELKQSSHDDLVFECLVPKPILQRYLSLLYEHRKIILCGPSGTGKSHLARKLAYNLLATNVTNQSCNSSSSSSSSASSSSVFVVNVEHKSSAKELRSYMMSLADQLSRPQHHESGGNLPGVIILENLHYVTSFSEIFSSFLSVQNNKSPFVIGTMSLSNNNNGCNLQLHHNFRWILLANHMEPVKGFLSRYLRRNLLQNCVMSSGNSTTLGSDSSYESLLHVMEWLCVVWQHVNKFIEAHNSAAVTMGPRLFLDCPMSLDGSRAWFLDLWNFAIVPYILDAVRDGLVTQGRRQPQWEDPTDWLLRSWPWPVPIKGTSDAQNLIHLRPEDVGFDTYQLVAMPTVTNGLGSHSNSSNNNYQAQHHQQMQQHQSTHNNNNNNNNSYINSVNNQLYQQHHLGNHHNGSNNALSIDTSSHFSGYYTPSSLAAYNNNSSTLQHNNHNSNSNNNISKFPLKNILKS